jgi:uncharacterized protein (TIGR02246 family)
MKKIFTFLLTLSFLLLFSCAEKVDIEAEKEVLTKKIVEWDIAFNNQDLDGIVSHYADDAVRMNSDVPAWVGIEAIRAGFKSDFESELSFETHNEVKDIRIFGDCAYLRGIYSITITQKNKGETFTETGKWMALNQRQSDGSWKILCDIWNRDHLPVNIE